MIVSNEFEEALAGRRCSPSYAEDRLMEQEYGLIPNLPLQASQISSPVFFTLEAWKIQLVNELRPELLSQGKADSVFHVSSRWKKRTKPNTIMRTYAAANSASRHPTSQDFQSVVEQVTS